MNSTVIWILSQRVTEYDRAMEASFLCPVCVKENVAQRLLSTGFCTTSKEHAKEWAKKNGSAGIDCSKQYDWTHLSYKAIMSKISG